MITEQEVVELLNARHNKNGRYLHLYHPKGKGEIEVLVAKVARTYDGDRYHLGDELYVVYRNGSGKLKKKLFQLSERNRHLYVKKVTIKSKCIEIEYDRAQEVPYYMVLSRKTEVVEIDPRS